MRKLIKTVAVTLVCASLAGGVAAADSNISDTGPGSNNSISTSVDNNSDTNCNNNDDLTTSNLQNAGSGNADVTGNTTGGDAQSGGASNNNNTNVNVNTSCGQLSSSSNPAPQGGGKGSGKVSGASTTATPVAVANGSLPDTGSNTAATLAVGSVVALGAVLLASRFGVSAYRRMTL